MNNLNNCKAVIVAGGKGTRLYPITKEIPKPLIPVCGKPIINYLVDLFSSYEIKDVCVIINAKNKEDFVWWQKRYYSAENPKIKIFEETEALGTFGAMWYLKDWVGDLPFFFTNGDEIKEIDLNKMAEFHSNAKTSATIALAEVSNPKEYGVAVCKDDLILEFLEKPQNPPSNYISSGFYLLTNDVFRHHPGPKFTMIEKEIFPNLAKENKLSGYKFKGTWMDCGTWERYEKALDFFNKNK